MFRLCISDLVWCANWSSDASSLADGAPVQITHAKQTMGKNFYCLVASTGKKWQSNIYQDAADKR